MDDIEALRRFNRFATAHAGALNEGLLASPFTLAEARVLWELRHRDGPPAAATVAHTLRLDPAYLSRILARFRAKGLVASIPGPDRRARRLLLTEAGEAAVDALEAASRAEAAAALAPLPETRRRRLRAAMAEVEALLTASDLPAAPVVLRAPRTGDMAWIAHRQSVLYASEYGWDARFEALVARICADFIDRPSPGDRGWIAEREGEILGAVFLVHDEAGAGEVRAGAGAGRVRGDSGAGKLRMLYVEPAARGSGLGRMLVREVIRAAREAGFARLDLWTHDVLVAARRIYATEGFRLVSSVPSDAFGARTTEEVWSLPL